MNCPECGHPLSYDRDDIIFCDWCGWDEYDDPYWYDDYYDEDEGVLYWD